MSFGRLEAEMTFTVNQTGTIDVGGGAVGWTVTAGSYYPTELAAELATQLSAGAGEEITVTPATGEGGAGRVTIDRTAAGNVAIVWTTSDIREAHGFTGNLSAANNYTSASAISGAWNPDCPMAPAYGPQDEGHREIPVVQTVNKQGYTKTIITGTGTRKNTVKWSHISRNRMREADDNGTPMSFERWMYETQLGGNGLFTPGGPVRLYWDADASDYATYNLILNGSTEMEPSDPSWTGLWPLTLVGYRTPGT